MTTPTHTTPAKATSPIRLVLVDDHRMFRSGVKAELDPAVTEKVLERVRRIAMGGATDDLAQLTSQEQKILLLVAEGKTNKEIASEVFLSDKTVKNYVSSILSKLNLQRRAQAAAYVAKRHGGAG